MAARPITDVCGTAAYRVHAVGVLGPAHTQVGLGRVSGRRWLMRLEVTVNGERREAEDVWEGESLLPCCASAWDFRGPRTPASRASAGHARCTWMARSSVPAWY